MLSFVTTVVLLAHRKEMFDKHADIVFFSQARLEMIPKRLDRQGILGIPNLTNLKTPYSLEWPEKVLMSYFSSCGFAMWQRLLTMQCGAVIR